MQPRGPLALCLLSLGLFPAAASGQDRDPFAIIADSKALCAATPDNPACLLAQAETVATVANALAEAGNSLDRGQFIAPVRALLADPNPEIRTSALYALAKLGPDATDTSALVALARDPVSNVRAGVWAAAAKSSDPAARRIAMRVGERPTGLGYAPDGAAFDPSALGFSLPEGLEYLWLAADLRKAGQLHFLSSQSPDDLLATLAPLAAGPAQPLTNASATDLTLGDAALSLLDAQVYRAPRVLTLPAAEGLPVRHLVVFDDLAFGQAGLAVLFADGRSLQPVPAETAAEITGDTPPAADAYDAALLRRSGLKPDADPDETELFMAIVAAGGFGAAEYLEIYPDGAYADEARAYLTAPQIVMGALTFTDTQDITVSFANLSEGAFADVRIVPKTPDAEPVVELRLYDATRDTARFSPDSRLVPGIYRAIATVDPGDGGAEISLMADFELVLGQAVLEADKIEYAPGETINVRFAGMPGDSQDYVSTAPVGSPNETFLTYAYAQGARDGSLTLPAPNEPGTYELRAFFREDESILRGSLPFTVAGTAAPLTDVQPAPAPNQPLQTTPTTPGTPGADARAILTLDKVDYAPGAPIKVTYADMFGHPQDYVAVVVAGAPNSSYLQYRYTEGAQSGTAEMTAPTEPGTYEIRAFFMEDEAILRAAVSFTVTGDAASTATAATTPSPDARATLALDKTSYAAGETITITYADMFGHSQDYVATAPAGSSNAIYMEYRYTEGAKSGTATLTAPSVSGAYEVRAFFMEDEAILRAFVPFTVE